MLVGQRIAKQRDSVVLSPTFEVVGEEHLNLVFDDTLRLLERRAIRERVLSYDELEQLRQPVLARMHMRLLEPGQVYGFLIFAAQGGIPLRVLQQDPLLPLDENLVRGLEPVEWLPPHLTERVINPTCDVAIQQQRIIGVMQRCMRQLHVDIPIFFLGSGAAQCSGLASDIDIGTSREVRSMYIGQYDTVAALMRNTLTADPLILGRKGHVGAVFDHMVLGLGVSVAWYGRAFRVTPDEVYAIEPRAV